MSVETEEGKKSRYLSSLPSLSSRHRMDWTVDSKIYSCGKFEREKTFSLDSKKNVDWKQIVNLNLINLILCLYQPADQMKYTPWSFLWF